MVIYSDLWCTMVYRILQLLDFWETSSGNLCNSFDVGERRGWSCWLSLSDLTGTPWPRKKLSECVSMRHSWLWKSADNWYIFRRIRPLELRKDLETMWSLVMAYMQVSVMITCSIILLCRYVSTKPEQQLATVLPGWVSRSGRKIWCQRLIQAIVATGHGSVLGAPPSRFRQYLDDTLWSSNIAVESRFLIRRFTMNPWMIIFHFAMLGIANR